MKAEVVKKEVVVNLELSLDELRIIREWAGDSSSHHAQFTKIRDIYDNVRKQVGE